MDSNIVGICDHLCVCVLDGRVDRIFDQMKVIVFTYNRPKMLKQVVDHLKANEIDFHVIDDGSDVDPTGKIVEADRITRFHHGGKQRFWMSFAYAFDISKRSEHNDFVFMPDDFLNLDIEALKSIASGWEESKYCVNLINDGRVECWGFHRMGLKPIKFDDQHLIEVGFCDCGFITNRLSLSNINIDPVPSTWFNMPNKSSGVGAQLSKKMRAEGVAMLKPERSFADHGDHPSIMHGDHRNEIPLISK